MAVCLTGESFQNCKMCIPILLTRAKLIFTIDSSQISAMFKLVELGGFGKPLLVY